MLGIDRKTAKIGFAIIFVALFAVAGLSFYFASKDVSTSGEIIGIGLNLWEDAGKTIPLTSIDWGLMNYDDEHIFTYYIESLSSDECVISSATSNEMINGSAGTLLGVWANFALSVEGLTFSAYETRAANFTLTTVMAPDYTTFSFDITITATTTET